VPLPAAQTDVIANLLEGDGAASRSSEPPIPNEAPPPTLRPPQDTRPPF